MMYLGIFHWIMANRLTGNLSKESFDKILVIH
jgi:hypothetical protein